MTSSQSTTRLVLYVLVAMVSSASAGLATVDFADTKQIISFILSIIATGLITARSYIDKTPSEVKPKADQP